MRSQTVKQTLFPKITTVFSRTTVLSVKVKCVGARTSLFSPRARSA